jgi:hypothetical protein
MILSGEARCDCYAAATRIDEAGKPECQRCHELNSCAFRFHDLTRNVQMEIIRESVEQEQYG